ncbi:photosystem I subunit K isoform X2 [Tasmannia lanceolata]|uniref:photosystem I subunit K isoform X2 n=1 Tax=Tasmannia lanceolata TaxID=3420 RepID=UPI004064319F
MAAKLTSATAVMTSLPHFNGLKSKPYIVPAQSLATLQPLRRKGNGALGARCDFIGSPTNLVSKCTHENGLKLEGRDSGLQTGDPAGFTLADTAACGSVGHIIGVGVVLGLKNLGVI